MSEGALRPGRTERGKRPPIPDTAGHASELSHAYLPEHEGRSRRAADHSRPYRQIRVTASCDRSRDSRFALTNLRTYNRRFVIDTRLPLAVRERRKE